MIPHGKVTKRTWRTCPEHGTAARRCKVAGCREGKKRIAFLFDIEVDGVRKRQQFSSRQEARDALESYKDELRHPKPAVVEPAPVRTFGAVVEAFLKQRTRRKTASEFERIARHLLGAFGKDTLITDITAECVAEYKAARLAITRNGEPLTAAAINRPLGLMRNVLRTALKWKLVSEVVDIEFEEEHEGRIRWLTHEESLRLREACRQSRNAALLDLVELLLFTGMRRGEALGLTWDRVDRSRGVVILEGTKNGKSREVPLNARADAVIARRWTQGAKGLVFPSRNWNAYRNAWERARREAGLEEDFKLHDLRHTYASWLVQRGAKLQEVKEILGHSDLKMTLRYAHLAQQHLRNAASLIDDVPALPDPSWAANRAATARSEVPAVA